MLTTPHLLVGAAIGATFHNPLLVAPAAAASHFALDSVPHLMGIIEVEDLDKKDLAFVVGDVLLGVSLVFLLSRNNPNSDLMWLGAFCAVLPDFHHTFQALFGPDKLEKYDKWHLKFHYKKPMDILPGIATQVLTVLLAVFLIRP
ncbi:MAG TPA: hypothetical protein VLE47_04685 [Candidatus Saccharimonadales bacterium]|nr:hypothetical protein [Candidatus Saccharimonadales bacterium]